MDFDIEQHRRECEQRHREAQNRVAALTADLEDLLEQPPNADILEKQAITMDALLRTIMRDNLKRDQNNGYIDHDYIVTALRIQKQCMDTIKAKAAMDYMNGLTTPPPPPEIEKRKEGS